MSGVEWYVGQRVYLRDVNENRRRDPAFIPPVVTIAKVGRTLVHVEEYGRLRAYGKDDGVRRDDYRHSWLQTFERYAEGIARSVATERLAALGLVFGLRGRAMTAAQINAIADLIDSFDGADA